MSSVSLGLLSSILEPMNKFMTHYVKKQIYIVDHERNGSTHLKAFENSFSIPLCISDRSNWNKSVRYLKRLSFCRGFCSAEINMFIYRTCDKLYRANKQLTIKEWNSFINPCSNIFAREKSKRNWNPLVPAPFFALSWRQMSHSLLLYYLNYFHPLPHLLLTCGFFSAKTVKARSGGREENWSLQPSTSEFWTIFFKYSKNKQRFWLLALR